MFDAKKTTQDCIQWIKDWFDANGNGCNAIIGISGGKDSSVVAALCVEALGVDRVIGVLMPNGEQKDISDAIHLKEHLGIDAYLIDISSAVSALQLEALGNVRLTEQSTVNLPPRIRMTALYMISHHTIQAS